MKYSSVRLSTHLFIPKAELRDIEATKRMCTVKRKFNGDPIEMYLETDAEIGVPLHFYRDAASIAASVADERTWGTKIGFRFRPSLRLGQPEVIEEFRYRVSAGYTGFILEAPPGFGKTVCLIKMLELLGRTALVVVPRSNLIKQWIERFEEHSSLTRSDIGWAEGGKADWVGKSVVVGLVHTLALDRLPEAFRQSFGVAVFDEVDRSVPPETFAPVVGMFPTMYRIGASATLKRADGLEKVFESHIGQTRIRGRDPDREKAKVIVHQFHKDSGYVHPGSPAINRRGMLLSRVSKNAKRNALIVHYIKMLYNSGRRTLVLSDRTEQLRTLRSLLANKGVPKGETGYYVRSMAAGNGKKKELSESYRARVASDCKVILATYGMIALGTDIPDLAGLVFATPQSDIAQSKGRIERMMEGKLTPVVVDIVDMLYEDAKRWGYARQRTYRSEGLTIKKYRER
jgi:superfamily II DNA or RNA helicase